MLDPREERFRFYFGCLAGWRYHPGYEREGTKRPSLLELAAEARRMVDIEDGRSWLNKEAE